MFPTQHAQLDLVRGVSGNKPMFQGREQTLMPRSISALQKTKGGREKGGGGVVFCAIRAGCPAPFCYETSECSFTSITQFFFFLLPCIHTKDPTLHTHYFASTTCLSPPMSGLGARHSRSTDCSWNQIADTSSAP